MIAKFKCDSVITTEYNQEAKLSAVTNGSKEDNSFCKATPWGELKLGISNPEVYDYLKPGKSYYLTFTEAN